MTAGRGPCHGQASFSGGTHTVHRGRDASWETKSGWPVPVWRSWTGWICQGSWRRGWAAWSWWGDRQFYMEQHRGVLRYSTEVIDIAAANMMVRITGRELQLLAMTDRELRISGTIAAIELLT